MLLTYGGETAADAPVLRTGGVPLVPDGFEWPECAECEGAMQFLAHLPVGGGEEAAASEAVSVFFCQNDPGLCDDWDAVGGGNRAYLFTGGLAELAPAVVPAEGETLLGAVSLLLPRPEGEVGDGEKVLGQLGGDVVWLQGDETPDCPGCAEPMAFLASLEEGYDHETSANFGGGGLSYVFSCRACVKAAFLWQC
ncbi:hypothetical protein [Streptomyces indicus]|nr:hypothetical protein [Streptomyces indicus]